MKVRKKSLPRLLALYFGVIALALGVFLLSGFQNAGNTGTFTAAQKVFTNQASATSKIFSNIGQSSHFLTYCNSSFIGSIDLEESFDGQNNWVPMARAIYTAQDSACHVLQAGGYFQNIRSVVAGTNGTLSAWYSSSSGPVAFAPSGLASGGAQPPPVCDQTAIRDISNSTTANIGGGATAGNTYAICGLTIAFNGTVAAGDISLGFAAGGACSGVTSEWHIFTTANTPQLILLPGFAIRSSSPTFQVPCLTNNSGSELLVTISGANIRLP